MRVLKPGTKAPEDRLFLGECPTCGAILEFTYGEAQTTGGPSFVTCGVVADRVFDRAKACAGIVIGHPEFSDEGARLRGIAESWAHGEVRAGEREGDEMSEMRVEYGITEDGDLCVVGPDGEPARVLANEHEIMDELNRLARRGASDAAGRVDGAEAEGRQGSVNR